jgi:hypothetical protein
MVIIDGHNLLWAVQGMADGPDEGISDVGLCRAVGLYLRRVKESGELIFDGPGPRDKSDFDNIVGIEVLFAGLGSDADTIIEGKIAANTAPRGLTVVSSDNRLRKAARARRANSVKSEDFWDRLVGELERRRRGAEEPNGKKHGLSEGETDQWLDFFGMEP